MDAAADGHSLRKGASVTLHVYHVWGAEAAVPLNAILATLGSGVFHCGVEVHSFEYSFGPLARQCNTGVYAAIPLSSEGYRHYTSVPLGITALSEEEVFACIRKLEEEWTAGGYDLLRRNCCHFSSELASVLGTESPPSWVAHLPSAGAAVLSAQCALGTWLYKFADRTMCCARSRIMDASNDADCLGVE